VLWTRVHGMCAIRLVECPRQDQGISAVKPVSSIEGKRTRVCQVLYYIHGDHCVIAVSRAVHYADGQPMAFSAPLDVLSQNTVGFASVV
jgi:hypothetical protein